MAESCRFAFAVHILALLATQPGRGMTSDALAGSVNTNPVVVRRIISALRRAGLVCCVKGAGGGATLCRDAETIGLDEIYRAIEPARSLKANRHQPNLRCAVARQIKRVLEDVYASAQEALEASLAERSLADTISDLESPAATAPRKSPGLRLKRPGSRLARKSG